MVAIVVLAVLGVSFAFLLYVVSKLFAVPTDERVEKVAQMLPGANCGGCGCAGCYDFAQKLVKAEAVPSQCPVSSEELRKKIAEFLGIQDRPKEKKVAFIHCGGSNEKSAKRAQYYGVRDCLSVDLLLKGDKACVFGCLGYGDCLRVCQFGAISIKDGIAVVDQQRCKGCGKCVTACPRGLIEMVPYKQAVFVNCNSADFGKDVLSVCKAGCIGCRKCEKVCPVGAISVIDNLAKIDYQKCINCGKCQKACPTGAIIFLNLTRERLDVK